MKKHIFFIATLVFSFATGQTKDSVNVNTIEAVTVNGKKALVERKVDRLVYHVQNSMLSQGSSGTEVLAATPLLKVDENKGLLAIAGKNGVSVMVNDRMLNLSGTELINYLQNLRSENILKIEVITTPPAKYDAQGNSGIINIVLKKNQNLGWSGYLTTNYTQKTYAGFTSVAGANYQNEKFKASVKILGYDGDKRSVENYKIIGQNSSVSRNDRRDMNDGLGLNANFDYSISKNANAGLVYDISKGHSNMDIKGNQDYFTNNIQTLQTVTDSKHRSDFTTQMLNLYFDQKFGEHKLSLGANYYGNLPYNNVNFTTTNIADHSAQIVRNLSSVDYKIYSGQADLTLNFKKIQMETGAKYSQFSNNSDISYFNLTNDNYIIDPSRSNLFNYKEKNYAAYVSFSKDFGEKWSAKAGLRYEYTQTSGYSPTTQSESENNYGKFFPTAYLSYKASGNNQFSINYSRRINRPYFRALDPFRWYSNPNTYYTGNPSLQPSFNHNIEFNYIFKNKFSANLYYQRTVDNFDQITFLDGKDVTSTYYNNHNQNIYGLNLNYTDTFFKVWESNISTSFSYNETQITRFNAVPKNGQSFYFSTNNTFQLNKGKTFFLFLNYWQSLPSRDGYTFVKNNASLDAGIKMSFVEKALQINLSVSDIFKQSVYKGDKYFADNTQSFNNYWDARRMTLSITYNFGNQKLKSNNRAINFEEKNRAQ
ncbi:TonB-dependent receptor [Chryseobacterium lactis]|uniref:TonB-dependent receptor n=1 Tax=Chryseobacterium lactis TaxID=1241981 RepID=A0A3G6RS47_CHRLC|nr:outer membrane beta-barrel family protein [Chryseobacterium lactis]AZA81088.1 TonB-dependent receptor [Chryseobacterium lactis]AZB06089.1 TonB-dependent receptor [Chryseobacterium lactis]PNW14939.1 TonB-dependent receptor [Chryseobacterium lactis]